MFNVFFGFYRVSLSSIDLAWMLTGFYWVLPSFTGFYWSWLSLIEFFLFCRSGPLLSIPWHSFDPIPTFFFIRIEFFFIGFSVSSEPMISEREWSRSPTLKAKLTGCPESCGSCLFFSLFWLLFFFFYFLAICAIFPSRPHSSQWEPNERGEAKTRKTILPIVTEFY